MREIVRSHRVHEGARVFHEGNEVRVLIRDISGRDGNRKVSLAISGSPERTESELIPDAGYRPICDGVDMCVRRVYRNRGKSVHVVYRIAAGYGVLWVPEVDYECFKRRG